MPLQCHFRPAFSSGCEHPTDLGGLEDVVQNLTCRVFPFPFALVHHKQLWRQDGDLGALTYFWITGDAEVSQALIRIYVDGETEPSITYQPAKVRLATICQRQNQCKIK